jgi:hypothetical protein
MIGQKSTTVDVVVGGVAAADRVIRIANVNRRRTTQYRALVGGPSVVRPALCYDLGAREEADTVLAILVKVAES